MGVMVIRHLCALRPDGSWMQDFHREVTAGGSFPSHLRFVRELLGRGCLHHLMGIQHRARAMAGPGKHLLSRPFSSA